MAVAEGEELFYETQHHAKGGGDNGGFQLLSQQVDGGSGSAFSLVSIGEGLYKIKEKWDKYMRPMASLKRTSLFISTCAEYVAVAFENQITVLKEDDNYNNPFGIFTSEDRSTIFKCGTWLESSGILGVIDNLDTFYIIKSNGEEVSRTTLRQLKLPLSISGLIALENFNAVQSMNGFCLVTTDGSLYCVEVTHAPKACIYSSSIAQPRVNGNSAQSVVCLDFHQDMSLIVMIYGSIGVSRNSASNHGFHSLYIWHVSRNIELNLLFSSPLGGLFSDTKSNLSTLTTPKVLISPQGKHVATLDASGCLNIYKLEHTPYSLSIISTDNYDSSKATDNSEHCGSKCLRNVFDFTWWSNHVLVLLMGDGHVVMFNFDSGLKNMGNDPELSLFLLERVKCREGYVFALEKLEENSVSHSIHEHLELTDSPTHFWSLISLSAKSISEMYTILIERKQYKKALGFANRFQLSEDEVFKSQWLNSDQGVNEINKYLSKIIDHSFVLSECLKVGSSEDSTTSLISHGLTITNGYEFSALEDGIDNIIWKYRMIRLQLLQFKDRLETFLGINMGRFSMQDYKKFRCLPIHVSAIALSESGKIGALNLLFKRHPYSLTAHNLLDVLSAIPETIPIQSYALLLPGKCPSSTITTRDEDWVECDEMVAFIDKISSSNFENEFDVKTENIIKRSVGLVWPSSTELSEWYKSRARDIDRLSGQLENSLSLVDFACKKDIADTGLQHFLEDIKYLHRLIYCDDEETALFMSLESWELLSDYEKFKMMLEAIKEDKVVKRLREIAIPFMHSRGDLQHLGSSSQLYEDSENAVSFLALWLKEVAAKNQMDICLTVIKEACKSLHVDRMFRDDVEAIKTTLECLYICTLTDCWNTMASMLSHLPRKTNKEVLSVHGNDSESVSSIRDLEREIKAAEGHVDVGRLLAYYQVPKPMCFFKGTHSDEKNLKQLLRLVLSKFSRRQPGDNDWANMWRDLQCFQEKAFPFLDKEYMLIEFCRGLLKSGKFSLAWSYLRGCDSINLEAEKAENLVVQAAREYFFSASSLSCPEIWKAQECLNLFPNSVNIKAELDVIDALTNKLPNLGVTILPVEFKQIRNPMEIINTVIKNQSGTYLDVDELIEIAKLLGLRSHEDISAIQEAVAREAAVAGDLQLTFDLCLILVKNGHGPIWDLASAIARGPTLENMDIFSRRNLLGFALSHCDDESIGELLHAWKNIDIQVHTEKLRMMTGTSPQNLLSEKTTLHPARHCQVRDIDEGKKCDSEINSKNMYNILSTVVKDFPCENGDIRDHILGDNGKYLSFVASELPWLLELCEKFEYNKSGSLDGRTSEKWDMPVKMQASLCILSWLSMNNMSPSDDLIASLAKSLMELPVTKEKDIMGFLYLLNFADASRGIKLIEEQLMSRENFQQVYNAMNLGMIYSSLQSSVTECSSPSQRRMLLLHRFQEKHEPFNADVMDKMDEVQATFWREWKSKLEEQKRLSDYAKQLEDIIPGVQTSRFLSGDIKYIEDAVLQFVDSVKLEKKHILKDAVRLGDAYGLDCKKVLLRYFCSALISEHWTNDEILAELSDFKNDIVTSARDVVSMICSSAYPEIDGCNKLRLSYMYSILSACHLRFKTTPEPTSSTETDLDHVHTLETFSYYKVLEQECSRVSFIKDLNFKKIAGLYDLNFKCFDEEVCKHICESTVEALADMVKALTCMYKYPKSKGLMLSWEAIYNHHVLNMLEDLETWSKTKLNVLNSENFLAFLTELEQIYNGSRVYIRYLSKEERVHIYRKYFMLSLPDFSVKGNLTNESERKICLLEILDFWINLADGIKEFFSYNEMLSSCFKVFRNLVKGDDISTDKVVSTISSYAESCLKDSTSTIEEILFCKSMVFSVCDFNEISSVFSQVQANNANLKNIPQNLLELYIEATNSCLNDLISSLSSCQQNLHMLLSSLHKYDSTSLAELNDIRHAVWSRLSSFSDDVHLPNHIRVYTLELMQSITGRIIVTDVKSWEGWNDHSNYDNKAMEKVDAPSKLTSTLVALKSIELASAILPSFKITSTDLTTIESAVSCFSRLSKVAISKQYVDKLQDLLEVWEELFTCSKDMEDEFSDVIEEKDNWSGDEWGDGWEENLSEEEPVKNDKFPKADSSSFLIHPLHACWTEIIKKYIMFSEHSSVIELMDKSLSRSPNFTLLSENEAQELFQLLMTTDCIDGLKFVLLLPYRSLWFQSLAILENKLQKSEGFFCSNKSSQEEHELLVLILSSSPEILPSILSDPAYRKIFSYLCFSIGHMSMMCQEDLLKHIQDGRNITNSATAFLFSGLLLPCFLAELVLAGQCLLAGSIFSKWMHTHLGFSLLNIAEVSLRTYFDGLYQKQLSGHSNLADLASTGFHVKNSCSKLKKKFGDLLLSSLSSLKTSIN